MTDESSSGNRWEPTAGEDTAPLAGSPAPADEPVAAEPAASQSGASQPGVAEPAAGGWRGRVRNAPTRATGGRGRTVAAAAVVLLVGGVAGFGVATVVHAADEGHHVETPGDGQLPGDPPRDGHDHGHGDQGDQPGEDGQGGPESGEDT